MSRAFVREQDDAYGVDTIPERLISEHRNLVTSDGLAAIEAAVTHAELALAAAHRDDDQSAIARASRDLRYWSERLATAEPQAAAPRDGRVHFGSTVSIVREDGRRQTFRVVGEDEADPARGSISYVAPLAQALLGKSVGDTVRAGAQDAEISEVH